MYCEFGEDSDVFITMSGERLECVGCSIHGGSFYANSTDTMSIHLQKHVDNGDRVPDYVEDRLWSDDDTNFPYA